MAILKSIPLYFTKLIPARPITLMEDSDKPASETKLDGMKRAGASVKELKEAEDGVVTGWEIVGRTEDSEQAKAWRKQLGAKAVRAIREDKDDDESPVKYWQIKLRRKQFKANGEYSDFVDVVRGDTLEDLDPSIIGNGSIGDARIYQYDYSFRQGGQQIEGTASVLMGVAIKKLVKYEPADREDFEKSEFKVVGGDTNTDLDGNPRDPYIEDDDDDEEETPKKRAKGKSKGKGKNADLYDDDLPF